MENIDFSICQKKIRNLLDSDVSILNNFINNNEKYLALLLSIGPPQKFNSLSPRVSSVIKFKNENKDFLNDLVALVDESVSYNSDAKDSLGILNNVLGKLRAENFNSKSFLNDFDYIERLEDSIGFILHDKKGSKNIEINGFELKTGTFNPLSKGVFSSFFANHAFLVRIKFLNSRFSFKRPVKIMSDSRFQIKIYIAVFLFCALLINPLLPTLEPVFSPYFNTSYLGGVLFFGLIFVFLIQIYFRKKNKNKKKIRLENTEFENIFDVEGGDQVESRRILTSSFMYRILDFTKKTSANRVYGFFFTGDEIYIKYDFLEAKYRDDIYADFYFLDINLNQGRKNAMEKIVEFYLEIKNITEMAKDLNVFYFDKGTFSKEILKKV